MLVALPDDVGARVDQKYGTSDCERRSVCEGGIVDEAAVSDDEGDAPLLDDDASGVDDANADAVVVMRVAADCHTARCGRRSFLTPANDLNATKVCVTELPQRVGEALAEAPRVGDARMMPEGTVLVLRDGVQMAVVADDIVADVLLRAAHIDPSLCSMRAAGAQWLRDGAWEAWLDSVDAEAVA